MILGFVGFLLVRVCVTLGCLSTPLCGMNDKKEIVIKALTQTAVPIPADGNVFGCFPLKSPGDDTYFFFAEPLAMTFI